MCFGEYIINSGYKEFSITVLRKRLFAVICTIAFLFFAVLARLLYVQIIWGDELQTKAIDQWTREIPVIAERGEITDRNGVVLAENSDTYSVFVRKKAVSNIEETAKTLATTLEKDYEYVYKRLTTTSSSEVTVANHVEKQKINELLKYNLSGVYYSRDNTRVYPYGDTLSQVLGITSNDNLGQSGLELKYDKYLRGINGEILYETDIVGVEIDGASATYTPAIDGMSVRLTIDYEIQTIAESVMKQAYTVQNPKTAAVIVLDPSSGEILACSSKPSFDLNNVPRDDLTLLNQLSRNTLISDSFEPGSTFKIITSAINVEEYLKGNKAAYSTTHVFNSGRYRYVGGQKIKCWSNHLSGKHSNLNLAGALNNSCNPVFVDIALSLGSDTMYDYIRKFNFGSVTGVDFNGEAQGMLLPKSAIKEMDLARIGFGQTIAVTAIQLASATAAVVNGGNYYTPHFVKEIYSGDLIAEIINPTLKTRVISEKASEIMRTMLEGVVAEGSGKQAYIEGYRVGGKTGTAQKYENGVIASGKYVSSFIGFFPADNPKYLALVIIDEPEGEYYGSTVAAPYAKELFEGIIKVKNL